MSILNLIACMPAVAIYGNLGKYMCEIDLDVGWFPMAYSCQKKSCLSSECCTSLLKDSLCWKSQVSMPIYNGSPEWYRDFSVWTFFLALASKIVFR